jgi:lysophospholipase L1-like esterase
MERNMEQRRRENLNLLRALSAVLLLVLLGAIVGATEFALGRMNNGYHYYETEGRFRAIRLKEWETNVIIKSHPESTYLKGTVGLTDKEFVVRTDENGFIVGSNPAFTNTKHRIVFLGGSTTETLPLPEDVRFPALVETLLRAKGLTDVNTLNSGVSGNNVVHSLFLMLGKLIDSNTSHVVLMENINDIGILLRKGSYWNDDDDKSIIVARNFSPIETIKAGAARYLPNIFYAARLALSNLREILAEREAQRRVKEPTITDLEYAEAAAQLHRKYRAELRTFAVVARENSITPIFMTQPARLDFQPETELPEPIRLAFQNLRHRGWSLGGLEELKFTYKQIATLHQENNSIIREVAAELNIPLIDLEVAMKKPEFFYDVVHMTEDGSREAARIISDKLYEILAPGQ